MARSTNMAEDTFEANDRPNEKPNREVIGRYVLHAPIARGGMATVHMARLVGAEGFSRTVAAKRLHPHLVEDQEFVTMFLDEARISSKIHHPNVVPVLDVVLDGTEVVLVQEYVHGVPLDRRLKASRERGEIPPVSVVSSVVSSVVAGIAAGLHAAHETRDEHDVPMEIVHRDVSPQNVIVGLNGIPRLLDFGIAKARSSVHVTQAGLFKGKVAYIAPEQLLGDAVRRTADIYSLGVLAWELATGQRRHPKGTDLENFKAVLTGTRPTITQALAPRRGDLGESDWASLVRLEPVIERALAMDAKDRFQTAAAFRDAVIQAVPAAPDDEVAAWARAELDDFLRARSQLIAASEDSWRNGGPVSSSGIKRTPSMKPGGAVAVSDENSIASTSQPTKASVTSESSIMESSVKELEKSRRAMRSLVFAFLGVSVVLAGLMIYVMRSQRGSANAGGTVAAATPVAPVAMAAAAITTPPAANVTTPTPVVAGAAASSALPAATEPTAAPPNKPTSYGRPSWNAKPTAKPTAADANPAVAAPAVATLPAEGAPAPEAKANCNPPFYFEGTKKVLKSECL
jgi:serine/threonine-protein kinase